MSQSVGVANIALVFKVARRAPELIPPASPTPYEYKELSDIDNLQGFRHQAPVILFYRNNNDDDDDKQSSLSGRDPARVVREATAKALVSYYPLAGRLRETPGGKFVVECNGEGVMFIEAEADVSLMEFGEPLMPPFSCLDQLLFDVPRSSAMLGSPLILIQVTKLKCGGFILALRLNHTMCDAKGLVQFMSAVAEFARGAQLPSIQPVWDRHLLTARNLPRVTYEHPKFDKIANSVGSIVPPNDIVHKSFFFGSMEIATLRRFIPPHLTKSTTFEILTACLWRCRTIALQPDPEEIVPIKCVVNARNRCNPPLPSGYYGNAYTYAIALPTAANLTSNPVGYALELVKNAKANVIKHYMTSLADLIAQNGMLHLTTTRSLVVSDVTWVGFDELDFGWGPPVYGGPAKSGVVATPGGTIVFVPFTNGKGEKGIVVPICLRRDEMDIFVKELNKLLSDVPEDPVPSFGSSLVIPSSL